MRSLIILSLLLVASCALSVQQQPVLTQRFIEELNSLPNMTWRAAYNNGRRVTNADMATLQQLIGVKQMQDYNGSLLPRRVFTKEELQKELPTSFDAAEHWPHCKTIPMIYEQGQCTSGWAISTTSTISDRMCTLAGHEKLQLSAINLMACCYICGEGCANGNAERSWEFWTKVGLVSEECQPYPFPPCEHYGAKGNYTPCGRYRPPTPTCDQTRCTSNRSSDKPIIYKGKKNYIVKGEEEFMREIMLNGPITAIFTAYVDFVGYRSGVYIHRGGKSVGVLSVRIVGWGVDKASGLKYWKVANSWNTDWGMKGYFLIRKGYDECGIEMQGMAGVPLQ